MDGWMTYGPKRLGAKTSLTGWEERHLECLFISCVCCCNISCEIMFFRFLTQHLRRKENVPVLRKCAVRCCHRYSAWACVRTRPMDLSWHPTEWLPVSQLRNAAWGGEALEEARLPRVAITGGFPNQHMWHNIVSKNVHSLSFILHPAWQNLQTLSCLPHFISRPTPIPHKYVLQIINWHMHNV